MTPPPHDRTCRPDLSACVSLFAARRTPAARMPQLAGPVVKARADSLRRLGNERLESFLGNAVGSRDQMLVESGNTGHGRNYAKMKLEGDFLEPGTLVDVTVTGREGTVLTVAGGPT